jgi:hypothetical protein
MSAKCSSCGAEILWMKTAQGKPIPLSVASKQKRFVLAPEIDNAVAFLLDTYLTHFADCPNAAQHRKPK